MPVPRHLPPKLEYFESRDHSSPQHEIRANIEFMPLPPHHQTDHLHHIVDRVPIQTHRPNEPAQFAFVSGKHLHELLLGVLGLCMFHQRKNSWVSHQQRTVTSSNGHPLRVMMNVDHGQASGNSCCRLGHSNECSFSAFLILAWQHAPPAQAWTLPF